MTQTQNPINEIKDRIYEAEGLLELLQLRADKLSELAPIILRRIDDAHGLFEKYIASHDNVLEEVPPREQDAITEDQDVIAEDSVENIVADSEPEPDQNSAGESVEDSAPALCAGLGEVDEVDDHLGEYTVEEDDTPEIVEVPAKADEEVADVPRKTVPAFCLNDRYRFRRTIFGGSEAEFNFTMKLVSGFRNFAQAEEFFYIDMGLDRDDDDVRDFMEIMSNYFGK